MTSTGWRLPKALAIAVPVLLVGLGTAMALWPRQPRPTSFSTASPSPGAISTPPTIGSLPAYPSEVLDGHTPKSLVQGVDCNHPPAQRPLQPLGGPPPPYSSAAAMGRDASVVAVGVVVDTRAYWRPHQPAPPGVTEANLPSITDETAAMMSTYQVEQAPKGNPGPRVQGWQEGIGTASLPCIGLAPVDQNASAYPAVGARYVLIYRDTAAYPRIESPSRYLVRDGRVYSSPDNAFALPTVGEPLADFIGSLGN